MAPLVPWVSQRTTGNYWEAAVVFNAKSTAIGFLSLRSNIDCASAGEMVTKQPLIRSMRTVKRETLKLISGWVSRSNDPQMVRSHYETCWGGGVN